MRTFIAVSLSPEIRLHCRRMQDRLKTSGADVKWVAPENIHLTLRFLGEIDPAESPRICGVLAGLAARTAAFALRPGGPGAFPGINSPRVIWLGIVEGAQELVRLSERLEEELERIGIPGDERGFSAHITLGRTRSPRNRAALADTLARLSAQAGPEAPAMPVRSLTLYRSTLSPRGPRYDVLQECPFTAAGGAAAPAA